MLSYRPISIDLGLLILRIVAGASMISHGWPKLMKVINGDMSFGDPIGVGPEISLILTVFAEFVCSILIIIGLKTKLFLIPLIITMVVAFFIVHGDDPFSSKEKAFLFLGMYVTLFLTGPGKYSADKMM